MSKKPFSETKIGKFLEKAKPIVGDIIGVVGDITGIEAVEKIGDYLNSRKEENAEVMALHIEFEKNKNDYSLELFRLEVQDLASARDREIQFMQQSGGKRDWVQGGLVICTVLLVLLSMVFLAFREIPKSNEAIFHMMLGGVVVQGMNSIYSYFFGSSKGSRSKDEIIKKAMQ